MATLIPPKADRRDTEGVSVGLMHPTGGKAIARLALAGIDLPDGWVVRQDHVRRGLVLRTAATVVGAGDRHLERARRARRSAWSRRPAAGRPSSTCPRPLAILQGVPGVDLWRLRGSARSIVERRDVAPRGRCGPAIPPTGSAIRQPGSSNISSPRPRWSRVRSGRARTSRRTSGTSWPGDGALVHVDLSWSQFPAGSSVRTYAMRDRATFGDGPETVRRVRTLLGRVTARLHAGIPAVRARDRAERRRRRSSHRTSSSLRGWRRGAERDDAALVEGLRPLDGGPSRAGAHGGR